MGAESSALDASDFPDKEEYIRFDVYNVNAAYDRYQHLSKNGTALTVTRRQFYEIFHDHTAIKNGRFLQLPMSQFDLFDSLDRQSVFVAEIFLALTLFSQGSIQEKIDVFMRVARTTVHGQCDNNGGEDETNTAEEVEQELNNAEVTLMFQAMRRALQKLGVVESAEDITGSDEESAKLKAQAKKRRAQMDQIVVEEIFKVVDKNNDGLLQASELEHWMKRNAWITLTFMTDEKTSAEKGKTLASAIPKRKLSVERNAKSSRRASIDRARKFEQGKNLKESASGVVVTRRKSVMSKEKVGRRSSMDALRSDFKTAIDKTSSFKALKNTEKGQRIRNDQFRKLASAHKTHVNAVANQDVLTDLILETDFDFKDLRELRLVFAQHCNKVEEEYHNPDGSRGIRKRHVLSRTACKRLLLDKLSGLTNGKVLDRVCDLFDKDHDGVIDFSEFIIGLSKLVVGPLEEKLEILFTIFDHNGDGSISLFEMCSLLTDCEDDMADCILFSEDLLRSLDGDGNGTIAPSEFVEALTRETVVADLFWNATPPLRQPPPEVRIRERRMSASALDVFYVNKIEAEFSASSELEGESEQKAKAEEADRSANNRPYTNKLLEARMEGLMKIVTESHTTKYKQIRRQSIAYQAQQVVDEIKHELEAEKARGLKKVGDIATLNAADFHPQAVARLDLQMFLSFWDKLVIQDMAMSPVYVGSFLDEMMHHCKLTSSARVWLKQCLEGYINHSILSDSVVNIQRLRSNSNSDNEEVVVPYKPQPGEGTIYPNEVLPAILRPYASTHQEKASIVLRCINEDGDNTVSHDELCKFIRSCGRSTQNNTSSVMEALQLMDKDGDGEITIEEVKNALATDPKIRDYFTFMFSGLDNADNIKVRSPKELKARASAKSAVQMGKGYEQNTKRGERTSMREKAAQGRRNSWMHGLQQTNGTQLAPIADSPSNETTTDKFGNELKKTRVTNCTAQARTENIRDGLVWGGKK